jgi:hypothetical protein
MSCVSYKSLMYYTGMSYRSNLSDVLHVLHVTSRKYKVLLSEC